MTQPLPPLLCNTPPPIDFDDDNDNDDFGDFERATTEYEAISVSPTSHHFKKASEYPERSLDTPPLPSEPDYSIEHNNFSKTKFLEDRESLARQVKSSNNTSDKHSEEGVQSDFVVNNDTSHKINVHNLTNEQFNENTLSDVLENRFGLETNEENSQSESLILYSHNLADGEDEDINNPQLINNVAFGHNTSLPSVHCDSVKTFNSITPPHDKILIESSSENAENKSVMISAFQLSTEFQTSEKDKSDKFENLQKLRIENITETETIINNVYADEGPASANSTGPDVDTQDSKDFKHLSNNDSNFMSEIPVHQTDPFSVNDSSSLVDFQFGADFSQFDANLCENSSDRKISEKNSYENDKRLSSSQTEDDDDFEDFQDFNTAKNEEVLNFGKMNDVSIQIPSISILPLTNFDSKIISILQDMFPCSEEKEISLDTRDIKQSHINCSSELNLKLGKREPPTALDYQWSHSKIKQSLIIALGIDSRNILYGEKWNNSVPRFAANLLPSEPLQPLKILDSANNSTSGYQKAKTTQDSTKYENVPEVEFDWNNSGLVNPLDGVKEILCEEKSEEIHSTQFCNANECHNQQASDKKTDSPKTESIDELIADVHNDLGENNSIEQPQHNSEEDFYYKDDDFSYEMPTSSPYVYPLKETHIYTPSKADFSEIENCKRVDDKGPFDFEYTVAAAGIIIDEKVVKKEYRDIEYDPKKLLTPLDISNKIENVSTENQNNVNTLKLTKFNTNNFIENRKDILNEGYNREDHLSKSGNPFDSISKSDNINKLDCTKDVFHVLQDESQINTMSENLKGVSQSTSQIFDSHEPAGDDDFTEFQFVPPPSFNESLKSHQFFQSAEQKNSNVSKTLTPTIMDEMILSPAVLLPQSIKFESNPKIEWPQPGINSEELARIEQLFPLTSEKDTITKNPLAPFSSKDEDDWSEFVSVPASSQSHLPASQHFPDTKNLTTSIPVKQADDEWSDFISSTPNAWSSFREMPQCSTWNQPLQNSFNIFASEQSSKFIGKSVPTKVYQGLNSNNNIGQQNILQNSPAISDLQKNHLVPPQQNQAKQVNSKQHLKQNVKRQSNAIPNMSMVPDLRFVASRSFINAPKSTTSKK